MPPWKLESPLVHLPLVSSALPKRWRLAGLVQIAPAPLLLHRRLRMRSHSTVLQVYRRGISILVCRQQLGSGVRKTVTILVSIQCMLEMRTNAHRRQVCSYRMSTKSVNFVDAELCSAVLEGSGEPLFSFSDPPLDCSLILFTVLDVRKRRAARAPHAEPIDKEETDIVHRG